MNDLEKKQFIDLVNNIIEHELFNFFKSKRKMISNCPDLEKVNFNNFIEYEIILKNIENDKYQNSNDLINDLKCIISIVNTNCPQDHIFKYIIKEYEIYLLKNICKICKSKTEDLNSKLNNYFHQLSFLTNNPPLEFFKNTK